MIQDLTITDAAVSKVADLILEEGNKNLKLRIFVQGGGCSGFQYGFVFEEVVNEDDFTIQKRSENHKLDLEFLIDSMSAQYFSGATIDYKDDLTGQQFVINNPNAQTTCGCGSSFSV